MRQFRTLLVVIGLLCLAAFAMAGPDAKPAAQPRATEDVITAKVLPAKITAKAGAEVSFKVDLHIADTWHLYDHSYVNDPESFFIGVDLLPGEGASLAGFKAKFPAGEEGEFMEEKVVMLHHHAEIEVTVKLPADASGDIALPLVLSAQACDDKICLQPSDVPVTAHITVE